MYSSQFTVSLNDFNYSQNPSDLLCQYILKNYTNITLPDTLTEQWISQNLPDTPMTSQIINFAQKNQIQKYNSVINYGYVFFIILGFCMLLSISLAYTDKILNTTIKDNKTKYVENTEQFGDFSEMLSWFSGFIPIILLLFFKLSINNIDSCSLYLWLALICSTYSILMGILVFIKNKTLIDYISSEILIICSLIFLLSYFSYNNNNLYFLLIIIIFIFFSFISNDYNVYIFCKIIYIALNFFTFIFSIYLLSTFDFNIRVIKSFNVFGFSSFVFLLMALCFSNIKSSKSSINNQRDLAIFFLIILSIILLITAIFTSSTDISILNYSLLAIFCLIIFVLSLLILFFNCYINRYDLFAIFLFILLFLMTNKYIMYTLLAITFFIFSLFLIDDDQYRFIIFFIFSFLFFIKTTIDTFVDY